MREILFKAKCLDNGEWVEGNLFWQMYDGVTTLCIQTEPINANDYGDIIGDWYMVDPETVCQYTGMTDKNGAKIFDGDIVSYNGSKETVYFDTSIRIPCFTTGIGFGSSTAKHPYKIGKRYVVVGNIHDKEEQIC